MRKYLLGILLTVVVLALASGLSYAQDEPPFGPPTQPLIPCTDKDTKATAPCDMIATQAEDIVGVWVVYFNAERGFVRFNADGTFQMGDAPDHIPGPSDVYPIGTFTVDKNGLFTSSDPIDMPDTCTDGTYIARVIKVGGQRVALNLAVQDDCFDPRRLDYAYTMLWAGE